MALAATPFHTARRTTSVDRDRRSGLHRYANVGLAFKEADAVRVLSEEQPAIDVRMEASMMRRSPGSRTRWCCIGRSAT
jgi:hypothetical protein